MRVMGLGGDDKLIWDADNPDSVAKAKARFTELLKKGYRAWSVKGQGKGEPITEFDQYAEKMIVAPPMAGG